MIRNIEMLKPEYKKFLELKYDKLDMRDTALELNMGKNKTYDLRKNLVNDIARFNRNFGTK